MTRRFLLAMAMCGLYGGAAFGATIVADHTVVERCATIPQAYIDLVKTMWATVPGESHSYGYRKGLVLLQGLDGRFQVSVLESGTPEGATSQHLRFSRATWGDVGAASGWVYGYGEEDWYTSTLAVDRTKAGITYCNSHALPLAAIGLGWCWDTTWHNSPGGTTDPVYQVRWAGSSVGGPDGDLRWGLDADDLALTGNHVSLDTYLAATQQYIDHCKANGYSTVVFFTTGAIDGYGGESGYQRHLKHQRTRDYVQSHADTVLFDYADILSWSDAGQENRVTWTDLGGTPRSFQQIHSDNMLDLGGSYAEDGDHIGERGAVRLAKAMWWMLARIAGWDGTATTTKLTPLLPCRALDTRNSDGNDAAAPALGANERRLFTVTGKCGVPADARAISANLTVVSASAAGDLQVIGGHLATTNTSTLSIPLTRARANNAIIQLSTAGDGTISVTNSSTGTVHFILDVNGYFR
jgi:hypothetical protein